MSPPPPTRRRRPLLHPSTSLRLTPPLRLRPFYLLTTSLSLLLLALLGFHPTLASRIAPPVPFSDKVLHFVGFTAASSQFYLAWEVEESAAWAWGWAWWREGVSGVVCAGGESFLFRVGVLSRLGGCRAWADLSWVLCQWVG